MTLYYCDVRDLTDALTDRLSPEDQVVQSMADASPTKWHRAHTTWFFETFVLQPNVAGYRPFDEHFCYLFNSYYEAVGPRHLRSERGLITRPDTATVGAYRKHVDEAMLSLLARDVEAPVAELIELGLHHEQQHQELILMDVLHLLSRNPTDPTYDSDHVSSAVADVFEWRGIAGGVTHIGHDGDGFSFDNEAPRHEVFLQPFQISSSLVTNGDWMAFIEDSGYERADLWMSEGWACVQANGWSAPLYWERQGDAFTKFSLRGRHAVALHEAVEHVSWFEADAYARWAGCRLPTEAEWEAAAPDPADDTGGWYGNVWQWTASPYVAYPGFEIAAGAVGEYNGKFMVNQQVLRGSSWATSPGHARRTYRNFFPTSARWCVGGLRLAR
jgi:ergothioneine biosynthesis protein EgtB